MRAPDERRNKVLLSVKTALGFPRELESADIPTKALSAPDWLDASELWRELEAQLEELSARFHMPEDRSQIIEVMRSIVRQHEIKKAVSWTDPILESLQLKEMLERLAVEHLYVGDPGSDVLARCEKANLGITTVDAVFVEEGALLLRGRSRRPRCVSLLPPVHLAVVTYDQRLRSLRDLSALLNSWIQEDGSLPGVFHLICGPSRTADIELELVLGAHGPKMVHVMAVDPAWIQNTHRAISSPGHSC